MVKEQIEHRIAVLTRNIRPESVSDRQIDMVKKSGLFDGSWYTARYPDVVLTGIDACAHYLQIGAYLLRDPSPRFSTSHYLEDNPDLVEAGVHPLLHYIAHGQREERRATAPKAGSSPMDKAGLGAILGPTALFSKRAEGRILEALGDPTTALARDLPAAAVTAATEILAAAVRPPRVSVVIPTWNRAHVICNALDSAVNQHYPAHQILVVDDGSDDGTPALLARRYADRIASGQIVLIDSAHGGVCAARNAGLARATGDLIAYLDSDNTWRPEYLAIMTAFFVERPEAMTAYAGLVLNDLDRDLRRMSGQAYNRAVMLRQNFVDLNVFMHRRLVSDQLGPFDLSLKRLVDWDLILRYTKLYEPVFVPFVGVDYYLDEAGLGNISRTVSKDEPRQAILTKNVRERIRYGLEEMRLAYVVWDWPAMSQTFLLNELRWLVRHGFDVKVYHHTGVDRAARLDFEVPVQQVADADALAEALIRDGRTLCHNHFVYPATTMLVWPACQKAGIPFTVFPHAVDIFQDKNRTRNRIAEIAADPLCAKIFVYSDHHRAFLAGQGVPPDKIAYNFQAVNLETFAKSPPRTPAATGPMRGVMVARFVEKKGIPTLIRAMAALPPGRIEIDLYGYGPLEDECRALARDLGVDGLQFRGALETPQAYATALAAADFMVVPSVVAANGDTEGFPTVILEAMAAGLPVVTTTVSSLPDFLIDEHNAILTEPGDPASLGDGLLRLAALPADRRAALIAAGRTFVRDRVGVDRTMQAYWDVWTEATLSLFMVTFNTPKYDDAETTFEIIHRVLRHTTTPFTLTIVDNASEAVFRDRLRRLAAGDPRIRLILLDENRFCGPASNLALRYGDATHAIYICSKEGFVARHGWERPLLDHMRDNPGTGLAGHLSHMPRFTRGSELATHPEFHQFRNPDFARANPDRPFRHVQGGVFILDRGVVADRGGFSDRLVQDMMDVEYSYFLESEGMALGKIDTVASLTVKTHPKLPAILTERTSVAHPVTLDLAATRLDRLDDRQLSACNLCGGLDTIEAGGSCTACGSSPFGRGLFTVLAHDWRCHRGEAAWLDCPSDPALVQTLATKMFDVKPRLTDGPFRLMVIDKVLPPAARDAALAHLATDGVMVLPGASEQDPGPLPAGVTQHRPVRFSRVLRSDWRPLLWLERSA